MDQIVLTMDSATATSAAMAAMTSASSAMDMGGSCKISMLWNWNTIDSCFIASSWRITSHGMFAGSCIGVILLVMCLEFLRKMSKEYDRYILQRFKDDKEGSTLYQRAQQQQQQKVATTTATPRTNQSNGNACCSDTSSDHEQQQYKPNIATISTAPTTLISPTIRFRPTLAQQSIRALLHTVTFAVAYFVMLLAMYYNGYFIICIFIGAYLGAFVFTWESVSVSTGSSSAGTPATEDVTVCCG